MDVAAVSAPMPKREPSWLRCIVKGCCTSSFWQEDNLKSIDGKVDECWQRWLGAELETYRQTRLRRGRQTDLVWHLRDSDFFVFFKNHKQLEFQSNTQQPDNIIHILCWGLSLSLKLILTNISIPLRNFSPSCSTNVNVDHLIHAKINSFQLQGTWTRYVAR